MAGRGERAGTMIVECSFQLNDGTEDGPSCWVRLLVEVPDLAPDAEDPYGGAHEAAKDALRPFLNNHTFFGEWEPMIVGVNHGQNMTGSESDERCD